MTLEGDKEPNRTPTVFECKNCSYFEPRNYDNLKKQTSAEGNKEKNQPKT